MEPTDNSPADGEPSKEISKNALKKQQKAEEAARKKAAKDAEKAAKKAAEPAKADKLGGEDMEDLDPTQYFENRMNSIVQLGGENAVGMFPHKFHADIRHDEFIQRFSALEDGTHMEDEVVSITGRLLSKRGQGKLMFYDLHASGVKIQIMSDLSRYEGGEEAFRHIHSLLKRGDLVGVRGAYHSIHRPVTFLYSLFSLFCAMEILIYLLILTCPNAQVFRANQRRESCRSSRRKSISCPRACTCCRSRTRD